mmetsp:Transcript_10191/g.32295  ORF Transcript_10191/g.32295 Transcript_10191/m.32295 type:complete len:239 (-) Transcript_10191:579-1295(-)
MSRGDEAAAVRAGDTCTRERQVRPMTSSMTAPGATVTEVGDRSSGDRTARSVGVAAWVSETARAVPGGGAGGREKTCTRPATKLPTDTATVCAAPTPPARSRSRPRTDSCSTSVATRSRPCVPKEVGSAMSPATATTAVTSAARRSSTCTVSCPPRSSMKICRGAAVPMSTVAKTVCVLPCHADASATVVGTPVAKERPCPTGARRSHSSPGRRTSCTASSAAPRPCQMTAVGTDTRE